MIFFSLLRGFRLLFLPCMILACTVLLSAVFYMRGRELMQGELRERIRTLTQTSALLFSHEDIQRIRTAEDAALPEYVRIVQLMNILRTANSDVRFVYLLRPTDDPAIFEFVADADSLHPFPPYYDLDQDGMIDEDDELVAPGTPYDVSEIPDFAAALEGTLTPPEPYSDQWGTYMSAFSPVLGPDGRPVAVLGIDVDIGHFQELSGRIFSVAAYLLTLLVGVVLSLFAAFILRRRRLEALKQLEVDRTALLDLATHQLGVPLATFRWWLEILREKKTASPDDVEALDQLQGGIDRMDHVIRSLQEAAHLQSGSVAYKAERTESEAFVRSITDIARHAFALKNQTIVLECGPALPAVRIDQKLIGGVLSELLENARGYSPENAVVTVRLSREHAMLRIDVEDYGCGIPADDLPRIFEKFTRAKNAHLTKPAGNGLGLYICKSIVEKSGGSIRLESKEGEGTTVTVLLPAA